MTILEKIDEIKNLFQKAQDWEERYRILMDIGRELPPLDGELQSEKFRIKGCQSQVWLVPEMQGNKLMFKADSDALLVKGIIALLVKVYSGQKPKDILECQADFLKDMGITDHLSMNRSNGLAAMLKQLKLYALAYHGLQQ